MQRKNWIAIHRWLGLCSGLVVIILGITGCLFAFEKEIYESLYHDHLVLESIPDNAQTKPLAELIFNVEKKWGAKYKVDRVIADQNPYKSWKFQAYEIDKKAWNYFDEYKLYQTVYVNPFTAEILKDENTKMQFFTLVKMLHWSLWLSTSIGQPIVGTATLIFVLLLFTGIILWWPNSKNKKAWSKRFKMKVNGTRKRFNYDLHNVLGFYVFSVALIIGITGLVMAFKWMMYSVYFVSNGASVERSEIVIPILDSTILSKNLTSTEKIFLSCQNQFKDATQISISIPQNEQDSVCNVFVNLNEGTYYKNHRLKYNLHKLEGISASFHDQKNGAERLLEMNYDIHIGAIGGIGGKILAFLVSFVCTSLPITGFIIWWNKK